eukprot:CAMPEP_0183300698 /NCGR_PEP_ID=MMETSP0160_2-20130417/7031_1 /TAXON_ID=2839 ORGANISM="Odontella Sinensis, Strain Grunow 1884" /NCGR_SAMPLE_ID=MMETSP0160_2 /ASSEMBLY_ACC=CAM_ASM_000250 /LENGTH=324 /DNA_ID=CAMNT_0025463165 /DNA_START=45 /DNA_END=1015 /DNA_ORIENTATION=+
MVRFTLVPIIMVLIDRVVALSTGAGSAGSSAGLEAAKTALLRTALVTGRGAWARPAERRALSELVSSLEDEARSTELSELGTASVDGTWELIASDLEPFRASAFFLALASRVESDLRRGASTAALSVHRLATSASEVERTAWNIEGGTLKSLVQLKVGSVPSLPLALEGVVVSSASMRSLDAPTSSVSSKWEITLTDTSVHRNRLKYGLPQESGLTPFENDSWLKFISGQVAPSGEIFSSALGKSPTAILDITLVGEDVLIARVPDLDKDSYFVFLKSDLESSPWGDVMDEIDERDKEGQSRSLLGSAAALGMLNPFFSRRARG